MVCQEEEEVLLLQKIVSLYDEISTLDSLHPSKHVDTLFTQLVLTCTSSPSPLDVSTLSQPLQRKRFHLISLCSQAESLLETHFSSLLSSSFKSPLLHLSLFPYLSNYHKLSLLELSLLQTHSPDLHPSKIAFLGSGPLPLSSILMASSTHLKSAVFHNFDLCPSATSMAARLVSSDHDLSRRMFFHTADVLSVTEELADFEVVFLAALVGLQRREKVEILKHLKAHMAPGAVLVVRSARGARAFLYPVVEVGDFEGFEVMCEFHPTDEVINSVVIARKVFEEKSEKEDEEKGGLKKGFLMGNKCSASAGFQGFSPMVEDFAMEEQRS